MWAEDEGTDVRALIHDRDTKFTAAFDEYFQRDDGGPVLTPPGAPIANCFIESWIGSAKRRTHVNRHAHRTLPFGGRACSSCPAAHADRTSPARGASAFPLVLVQQIGEAMDDLGVLVKEVGLFAGVVL